MLLLSSCQWQEPWHDVQETRFLLGTLVSFTVYSNDEEKALAAIQQASAIMQSVEQSFTSFTDVDNSVQRFNHALAGEVITLTADVDGLLRQSLQIQQQSLGAFDPVLGALNQAWAFSEAKNQQKPLSADLIEQALNVSGVLQLQAVSGMKWTKNKNQTQLDFGAIAKGFAIDQGIQSLQTSGIEHAIINAGGDLRILGNHGDKAWKVAVRHPRLKQPLGWFDIEDDSSVVTSGDYERFFVYESKRYHHILNPKTGQPADKNMSVTVLTASATLADAWSTALFVLDVETGLKMVENMPDLEALWVDKHQVLHLSSGMKKMFFPSKAH
ncbi:MAG: FAD:protein FMN transferase [Mariprofundaceae bacterium]|nr:FAD:protein FMN transferase [Mariprofundaceae bacterium]